MAGRDELIMSERNTVAPESATADIVSRTIKVLVNGTEYVKEAPARMLLSDFLRHELRLTGTHVGCEHGACGACTVMLDGVAIRSCLILAIQVDGAAITTVEGLGSEAGLSRLQEAFSENHALQCGFCTPGILCSVTAASLHSAEITDDEIEDLLGGHMCRCTGYQNIRAAVRSYLREGKA